MFVPDSSAYEAIVAALGWALLHFLWQGAIAGVLFGLALGAAQRASARTRYRIGLFFLALLAALPVATYFWIAPLPGDTVEQAIAVTAATTQAVIAAATGGETDWTAAVEPWLPWTVLVWALGVVVMTARLLLEWRAVRRLTSLDVEPLPPQWQERALRLAARFGVHRTVRLMQSARVHVPMVVGWLKPVILVPVTAFSGLTPWQLELILMHELAHVRRHDYLVNLLQVVVETLLFYHPVVRWVSRVVREEREHCCDDLVVQRSGDALAYARALTELAGAQSLGLQTSVGSDGGKLLTRIKRLVMAAEPQRVTTHWSVGLMLGALGLSVSGLLPPVGNREEPVDEPAADVVAAPEAAPGSVLPVALPDAMPAREIAPGEIEFAGGTDGQIGAPPVIEAATAQASDVSSSQASGSAPDVSNVTATGNAPEALAVSEPASSGASPSMPAPATDAVATASTAAAPTTVPAPEAGRGPEFGPAAEQSDAGGEQVEAKALFLQQPEFPKEARLRGVEGWVRFSYVIARDGSVRDVQVLEGTPRRVFDGAVRRAVRKWRFEPVVVDGVPTELQVTQTVEFALSDPNEDTEQVCTATRLCRAAIATR